MGKDHDSANVDRLIDANLRRVYDSVLHEDVPDRFADLLRRLEQGEDVGAAPRGGATSAAGRGGR